MMPALRFHWSLSQAGDPFRRAGATRAMKGVPELDAQLELCRSAERNGIESVLMAISFTRPDPLVLTTVLGLETERLKFMVACRAGLISPTLFTQQLNTLASLIGPRVLVNFVSGHTPRELYAYGDFLEHDQRFARTAEFLSVCQALWRGASVNFKGSYYQVEEARLGTRAQAPEIYVSGNSQAAADLAQTHAHCLWRFPKPPDLLAPLILPLLRSGTEVGLLVSLIGRPTRAEAHQAAADLIARFGEDAKRAHRDFARHSDSVGFRANYAQAENHERPWLDDVLWTGAVPVLGAPAIALVGSYDDIAGALMHYQRLGVSQFLFMGWPDLDELERFGTELLPRVRALEAQDVHEQQGAMPWP